MGAEEVLNQRTIDVIYGSELLANIAHAQGLPEEEIKATFEPIK